MTSPQLFTLLIQLSLFTIGKNKQIEIENRVFREINLDFILRQNGTALVVTAWAAAGDRQQDRAAGDRALQDKQRQSFNASMGAVSTRHPGMINASI